MATLTFQNTIPSEVRLRIFKYALCFEWPVVMADSSKPDRRRINTSLFVVNKLISTEAIDAFYEVNLIRLSDSDSEIQICWRKDFKAFVRNVEFVNFIKAKGHDSAHMKVLCDGMAQLGSAPKRQSTTVAIDEYKDSIQAELTTRQWIQKLFGDRKIKCVDIGHFQIEMVNHKLMKFKHLRLIEQWSAVKNTLSTQDTNGALEAAFKQWNLLHPGQLPYVLIKAMVDLLTFLILHWNAELYANSLVQGPLPDDDASRTLAKIIQQAVADGFKASLESRDGSPTLRVFKQGEKPISILGLGPQNDSEQLEWATEILLSNVIFEEDRRQNVVDHLKELGALFQTGQPSQAQENSSG